MKKVYLITVSILFISFSLISCRKNDANIPENNTADLQQIQQFFDQNKPKYETFTLNASAGGTITLASGTKITFPPNAFTKAGNAVSGNVEVSALDILKPSEMILGNRPTVTDDGKMLESFGEIIVRARQNGAEIQLNNNADGEGVNVALAVGAGKGRQIDGIPIWDGDTVITQTSSGNNHENQLVTISTQISVRKGIEWTQIPGNFGFANTSTSYFNLDALGDWRNVDIFYHDPRPKTTVLGFFGEHFNASTATDYTGQEPSMLYFKPRGNNTLVKLYNVIFNPAAGKEGLLSYQNMMPIGLEGTFLAITTQNGKFYAEMRDVTIGTPDSGKNYVAFTFNFSEVSETQLLNLINQMNSK